MSMLGTPSSRKRRRGREQSYFSLERRNMTSSESVNANSIRANQLSIRQTKLTWEESPSVCLITRKWHDVDAHAEMIDLSKWLKERDIHVIVDCDPKDAVGFEVFDKEDPQPIDFIVALGGDGLVLHTAGMFPGPVPPLLGVAMGSLGFITPHDTSTYREEISRVLDAHEDGKSVKLVLRMRLLAKVIRAQQNVSHVSSTLNASGAVTKKGTIQEKYTCLNEILINRGPSAFPISLDCFVDGCELTNVQGDGVLLSTPTGSTAYSLSAGGPIVAPSVPAILLTPVAPHSLSCRPVVFSDSSKIRIEVPLQSRHNAWATFDGRTAIELHPGDVVEAWMSPWPVPMITVHEFQGEWVQSLNHKLHWNTRERQRPFRPAHKAGSVGASSTINGLHSSGTRQIGTGAVGISTQHQHHQVLPHHPHIAVENRRSETPVPTLTHEHIHSNTNVTPSPVPINSTTAIDSNHSNKQQEQPSSLAQEAAKIVPPSSTMAVIAAKVDSENRSRSANNSPMNDEIE
eukprot:TRINITY_DN102614_c0_g1_i2.p1 TRINITY_DN102614_c0_g1~~TRINITY_DN102614_c0_g1_i2.p1  ORF type:complete len:515 (+),score=137.57 TRINITY_DN102614_c0_g1_i2:193-1737(+)